MRHKPHLLSAPAIRSSMLRALFTGIMTLAINSATSGERPQKGENIRPEAIYHNYCSVCHGDRGDGNSRAKGSLVPPPKDFTRAPELTRESMIYFVTHGKPGTAMTGWATQLTDKEIESVVDYIRNSFMSVALDPRLVKGRSLYTHNCAVCHGERGQGMPATLGSIAPRNLASPQSRAELTRERMVQSVTHGRPNTAMAAFTGRLSADEIESVVDYVRAALMVPETGQISGTDAHSGRRTKSASTDDKNRPFQSHLKADPVKGEQLYMKTCATCHGKEGDGQGPRAYFIRPVPRNFLDAQFQASFNRPAIYNAVSQGRLGTEMPAWSKVLTEQEMIDVSEFVFQRFIKHVKTKKTGGKGTS